MSPSVRGRRPGPPALPAEEDEEVDLDGPAFVPPAKPIILPNTCVQPRHSRPLPWGPGRTRVDGHASATVRGRASLHEGRPCPCCVRRGVARRAAPNASRSGGVVPLSKCRHWLMPAPCTAHIAEATRPGAHILTCLNCCTIHLCLPCTPVPCRAVPCLVSCPVLSGTCWATRVLTT